MSQPTKPLSTRIGFTLAATGAIYLAPGATQAGIMSMADVGGSPFSGSAASLQATPIAWDVDNDGNFDFQFFGSSGAPLIGVGDAPGNGWVVATANTSSQAINNLPLSFSVGSQAGYAIGATGTSHLLQAVGVFWNAQGFTSGVAGYSGFTFMIGTNQHYGWVEWTHTLATGPGGGLVEVSNWAFEDSPDTPIHLADTSSSVPAPGSLALLAGGVGWLLAWRRRRSTAGAGRAVAA